MRQQPLFRNSLGKYLFESGGTRLMPKPRSKISKAERNLVASLVAYFIKNQHLVAVMLQQLSNAILGSPALMAHVHSTKLRVKDPAHLEDKLFRKLVEVKENGKPFTISEKNLFYRIN